MAELKKFLFDNFVVENHPEANKEEPDVQDLNASDAEDMPVEEPQEPVFQSEPEIPEEPEITYTQDQVDEMLREAEQKGYEKGVKSAQEGIEAKISNSLSDMNAKLKNISVDTCGINEDMEKQFVEMSKVIVQQLIPTLTEEHAVEIVNNFIENNFNNFRKEKKLSFYLHPDIIQYVQENISKLANANDFEGKISLHKDETLGLSDCRVEWESGGVENSTKNLLKKVDNLLSEK